MRNRAQVLPRPACHAPRSSDIHGNLYIFNRNSKFSANSFFNNASATPRRFSTATNSAAASAARFPSPYIGEGVPAFWKHKAFFFFNYEQFRLAQQVRISTLNTLLGPAQQGLFTYNRAGVGLTTVNVLTGRDSQAVLPPDKAA